MRKEPNFYERLPSFSRFEEFTDPSLYEALPGDWDIFITDIQGSTQAIERGEYRNVNLVGAAAITVCMKLLEGVDFPFVFGGDGASVCVPPGLGDKVAGELDKLRSFSKANFDLELRVARIPAKRIYQEGKDILVGKFEMTENKAIAVFKGGGLGLADEIAKKDYEKYKVSITGQAIEELEGLSCRWNPIPSTKGKMVSLLVRSAREEDKNLFGEIVDKLRAILGGNFDEAAPVNLSGMTYKSFGKAIKDEIKFHKNAFSLGFLKRLLEIAFTVMVFKRGLSFKSFDRKAYCASMTGHSDSKKFDDTLRLVIDCGEEEIEAIKKLLESYRKAGRAYYGIHLSDDALMTCYVENVKQGGHIHFIDGGGGGYAMAAKQMKSQMSLKSETKEFA